jgi:hypothetical protein
MIVQQILTWGMSDISRHRITDDEGKAFELVMERALHPVTGEPVVVTYHEYDNEEQPPSTLA